MSTRLPDFPHWLRDLDANLPVTAQFIVHGNIRDQHLLPPADAGGRPPIIDTVGALWATLQASGFELLLYHSPIHGLQVVGDSTAVERAAGLVQGTPAVVGQPTTYEALAAVLRHVDEGAAPPPRFGLVVDYVSQLRTAGEPPDPDLHTFMLAALGHVHHGQAYVRAGARTAAIHNPVIWLVDRPGDLPTWLVAGSDRIRQIPVPLPTLELRLRAARLLAPLLRVADPADPPDLPVIVRKFAEATDRLTIRAMTEVGQLARDAGVPAERIEDSVRAYRVGLLDDPWKGPELRQRISQGEAVLNNQVKGQPRAVRHAVDVLVRTTMALSGSFQGRRAAGPRGVMFFAGPTGVGKTELAKAITALVFGDARSYVRFDMSEFSAEHSEARLIGSPPGFIGHGGGGELTNAVRQRPFSLVLFDEIEKAHPRILDKFLQILSDGRLTDGSGSTVHFSETIIVFTSNLGVRGVVAEGATDAARSASYERSVIASVEREFRDGLNRPELLGRIGDNIVVFDYLTEATGRLLVAEFLANVIQRIQTEHGIALSINPAAQSEIAHRCTADMSLGGRGVGQHLETVFVNPLARALITVEGAQAATVSGLIEIDGGFQVELTCE